MFHNWLDQWDERQASRKDEVKKPTDFVLGANTGFANAKNVASFEGFCSLADQAVSDPTFFAEPSGSSLDVERHENWIRFPSGISTAIDENNVVTARITECGSFDRALVVFHHWNANKRNSQIAKFLSRRGITVVEMALPYHFERSRPGSFHADHMLSANLGRTIQSIRQGVWDGRKLIRWLKSEGYRDISVLGMSLGSWVAGLVAANDAAVSKGSLFLTAGSLADMVWTGRATRAIRDSLEQEIELKDLRRAWAPINMENYADRLARPELELQVVLAKRDKVVLPEVSEKFVQKLKEAGARPNILELNCGHYSLALPPYILVAGFSLQRLLRQSH